MEENKNSLVGTATGDMADSCEGLSSQQVLERMHRQLDNKKVESSTKSVSEIVKENVFTYFNLVFFVLGVLLAMVGAWRDMLFLVIIVANTLIGIVQEVHAKKVLDKLNLLNVVKITTLRDGGKTEVDCEELVQDDVVFLSAGNQIPADAIVLEGEASVNEALLTGEEDEIKKCPGDELLSGSFVVSGTIKAKLTKVGKESYISKLTIQATKTKEEEQSEMIRSLKYLIVVMGILILPIGTALFSQAYFINDNSFHDSITGMVAAVIGMIPEGLFLLASVAMAVSTARLAQKKVLVHDMKCIETLARVNVLCVDKTGTITEPGMQVYAVLPVNEEDEETLNKTIADFVQNMTNDNETMAAMQSYFRNGTGAKPDRIFGFSSQNKYCAAKFGEESYVLGAPEFVLREYMEAYQALLEEQSAKGYRVLTFGKYLGTLDGKALTQEVKPLGFVLLLNPIRKGAEETFSYFAEHDVEIKVISGDNPLTVSVIAQKAGIQNAKNYIDATTLSTEKEIEEAVENYTVFGRVTPNQKKQLVQALKKQKKTVAMTGDGVNDVLALKCADCSVAMASGSDAASSVSQLVLLDSDFSRMPSVVMEGRRVVNNIERTAALYIVKNIFSMLLALVSIFLMWEYPLEPTQISLVSMFTIGIPTFFLALEPNKNPIHGHFLVNVFVKALPAGLTDFLVVTGLVLFCREFEVELDCLSTSCTVLLAIVGFMILYRIAKPMNRFHIVLISVVIAGWLFCMFYLPGFFGITGISRQCAMLMCVFALITEPVLRYLSIFVEWLYGKGSKYYRRFKICCTNITNCI